MQADQKSLHIAYVGDTHGQVEGDQITKLGGFARLVSAFKQQTKKNPATLKLFGGDLIGQTPYTTEFKGEADAKVLRLIGFDACVPGNADFNYGTEHFASLIDQLNAPFVAANLNCDQDPHLKQRIQPYIICEVEGLEVAIIGLVTEEIKKLGAERTGGVKLLPLEESLRTAIESAKEKGAKQIVVLSHCGYQVDVQLAEAVFGDLNISAVIVGNHTHTTLGTSLSVKDFGVSKGAYPTVVEHNYGYSVLVTNIPPHGQVLGCLSVEYDEFGCFMSHSKNDMQVMNSEVPQDKEAQEIIAMFQGDLPDTLTEELLHAQVDISGLEGLPAYCKPIEDYIRQTESPIGNLAADAFCWYANKLAQQPVDFALIHAGGIRTDWGAGKLTGADIYRLHPFDKHFVYVMELTGAEIKAALEEGVFNESYGRRAGFLIGSQALTYQYKISDERNERVCRIHINGAAIDYGKTYRVAINGFMATGNNCNGETTVFHALLKQGRTHQKFEQLDRDAIFAFLRDHKERTGELYQLTGKLEGRIQCLGGSVLEKFAERGVSPENVYLSALTALKLAAIKRNQQQAAQEPVQKVDPRAEQANTVSL